MGIEAVATAGAFEMGQVCTQAFFQENALGFQKRQGVDEHAVMPDGKMQVDPGGAAPAPVGAAHQPKLISPGHQISLSIPEGVGHRCSPKTLA